MDLSEIPARPFVRHPWEVARVRFFTDVPRRHGLLDRPLNVLDVGAGDGFLAGRLATSLPAGSRVVCFDPYYSDSFLTSMSNSTPPGCSFTRSEPDASFDLVLLLDVLEHVADDAGLLTDLVQRHLSTGKHALISVPAHNHLFTAHDIRLGHFRRYSGSQLLRLAERSGLSVVAGGGLFHTLLFPRMVRKAAELSRGIQSAPDPGAVVDGESDLVGWTGGTVATAVVAGALQADNALSLLAARFGVAVPGLSTWVLARRP